MNFCTLFRIAWDNFHVLPGVKQQKAANWRRRGSRPYRNNRQPGPGSGWQSSLFFFMAVACAGLLITGCSHFSGTKKETKAEVKSLQGKTGEVGKTTVSGLQAEVRRFADDYAATVAQASDDFSSSGITNETMRIAALKWKLEQATAAYIDASGRNAILNALDLVVLANLSRMVVESLIDSGWLPSQGQVLLQEHRKLETNAWKLVEGVLKPEQKEELSQLIQQWRRQHPDQRYVGGIRFREFAAGLGDIPEAAKKKPTSVFNLLFLDPMAGLDPTARAIQETRLSADSITYYAQRAPFLIAWQAELLSYQLTDQPATRRVLANVDQLSASVDSFAKVADRIPEIIDQQRQAAIKQIVEGIATERTNFVASLASQEANARTLLTDTRETLQAGTQMASSVNDAIRSLHAFTGSFNAGAGSNAPATPQETPKKPFNILDYGEAAQQVGAMALQVNTLLTSATQATPQLKQLGGETRQQAEQLVHHAFWLALVLVVAAITLVLVACLAYRFLVLRWTARIQPNQAVHQSRIDI